MERAQRVVRPGTPIVPAGRDTAIPPPMSSPPDITVLVGSPLRPTVVPISVIPRAFRAFLTARESIVLPDKRSMVRPAIRPATILPEDTIVLPEPPVVGTAIPPPSASPAGDTTVLPETISVGSTAIRAVKSTVRDNTAPAGMRPPARGNAVPPHTPIIVVPANVRMAPRPQEQPLPPLPPLRLLPPRPPRPPRPPPPPPPPLRKPSQQINRRP